MNILNCIRRIYSKFSPLKYFGDLFILSIFRFRGKMPNDSFEYEIKLSEAVKV